MKRAYLLLCVLGACSPGKTNDTTNDKAPPPPPVAPAAPTAQVPPTSATMVLAPAPPLPPIPAGLPPFDSDLGDAASVTPDRVMFGELLFTDTRLSEHGDLACATCHDPAHGFSGTTQHPGTPLVDLGWVLSPMLHLVSHSGIKMGLDLYSSFAKLESDPTIRAHLARVPSGLEATPGMEAAIAISAYVSTRYEGDAPWDRAERAGTPSPELAAGYKLFMGKARCAQCHTPPLYSDGKLHKLDAPGVADTGPRAKGDRTPTLRGATKRLAFFHDGRATSLDAALTTHLAGGGELAPVELTAPERTQLLAFISSLTASAK